MNANKAYLPDLASLSLFCLVIVTVMMVATAATNAAKVQKRKQENKPLFIITTVSQLASKHWIRLSCSLARYFPVNVSPPRS